MSLLEGHGFRPASIHRRRSDREFAYELCREYKEFDLQSTRYMTAGSSNCFAVMAYRAASTENLQLPPGRLPKGLEIGQAYTWTVVSDTGRSKLEKENLSHVVFRPVEQATKVGSPNVTVDGYWELTSDLVLPPLSKQCVLMNNDGEVFSGDYKAGCFLIEGFYQPAEMHYEAGALKPVEPFDLAMTYEKFGNTASSVNRAHIASQRLYEVCRKYNLKFGGIPVRVDE